MLCADIDLGCNRDPDAGARDLLEGSPDPARASIGGGTSPLHLASQCGHFGVVTELLSAGADVSRANQDGATPLHFRC
ncbi:unnamed protein product [Discosporangium mesarthrocarpum]